MDQEPTASDAPRQRSRRSLIARKSGYWLATAVCWYLSVLIVVNFVTAPVFDGNGVAGVVADLFPTLGSSSSQNINQASVDKLWNLVQDDYVYRQVPSSLGTSGSEQGIAGALETTYGDHFTLFFTPAEDGALTQQLGGTLTGGIGVEIGAGCGAAPVCPGTQQPNDVLIDAVLRNQPANSAGVKTDDVLVAVNGKSLTSLSHSVATQITDAGNLIRGKPGTTVSLTFDRDGSDVTVVVTRQNLVIPSVYTEHLGSVLYLEITGFNQGTGAAVKQALAKNMSGVTGIVLDMRDNPGGYVTEAESTVSQFVALSATDKNVVVQRGRMTVSGGPASAQDVQTYPLESGGLATNHAIKVVVLVDDNTASAAEITTMALRDYHRATAIVGERTYGKGTVQETFALPDGNDIHLTVGLWYGPDNENINNVGIEPTTVVGLDQAGDRFELDVLSPSPASDLQLQAALKVAD